MPSDDSLDLFPQEAPEPETPTPPSPFAGDRPSLRAPLAERMRPRALSEVVGQDALLGPGAGLRSLVDADELPSLILWGPPGCGKTTLARLLSKHSDMRFEQLSAVMAGVKEIRAKIENARRGRALKRRTLLFLDEIHRLNRTQQDALLPHVEAGDITLIGATTENPSFEVIAPLLSRCRVFTLARLSDAALITLLRRAAEDEERGLGELRVEFDDEVARALAAAADGDARRGLSLLEAAAAIHQGSAARELPLSLDSVREAVGTRMLVHDRDREEHYNVVSAFIKSLRASDPDAALYYAARMLDAGEDPLFLARRLVIFASEDVGNAEPSALSLALSAYQVVERIGMPEGRIPLAQATTFLACAPKSNAAYLGINRASEAVRERGSLPVPLHLRNAPTGLMKGLHYGRDYKYPHDAKDQYVAAWNLPVELGRPVFYEPKNVGAEREIAARLDDLRKRRSEPK